MSKDIETWRLIPLLNATGEVQMAIDRWLLQQHQHHNHPSTLRFYTWEKPTISLGYHQKDYPDQWNTLPIDIVRRPTGGQAVLHGEDLTYAVVTSRAAGKRGETYRYLCQFLIDGWRSLGVKLDYGKATLQYASSPNCFATATNADLVTEAGRKAIGSAQLRRRKAILQHGSMNLSDETGLFIKIFNELPPENLLTAIPSSENRDITQIINTLTSAAKDWFKINIVLQPLSKAEWQDIFN